MSFRLGTRVLPCTLAAWLAAMLFSAPMAHAAWPYNPSIGSLPVSTAVGDQEVVRSISDGAGGAILVWEDSRTGLDIYAQRVDATGTPRWTAGGLAICTATGSQYEPALVGDGAGGAIIAWTDVRGATSEIYVQRVNAAGVVQWTANGVAITAVSGAQLSPTIASDGAGGAILAWEDGRVAQPDVYVQRVNASGVPQWAGNGTAACAATGFQTLPGIVADGAGGAIVAWQDGRAATQDVYAQRVNSSGVSQWSVNGAPVCVSAGDQFEPRIASDDQGGALVSWSDTRAGAANFDVYAQKLSTTGAALWGATGLGVCTLTGHQFSPELVHDGMGGAWMTWQDFRSGVAYDIAYQHVYASGLGAFGTNGTQGSVLFSGQGDQTSPRLVGDGLGGVIILWMDLRSAVATDVYASRVTDLGRVLWGTYGAVVCAAAGAQHAPVLVSDQQAGAVVAWADYRSGIGSSDVYAQRVDMNGALGNAAPRITSVRDVPNDQGGHVRLTFRPSYLDTIAPSVYRQYRGWRSVATLGLKSAERTARITRDPREAVAKGMLLAGATADYAWEPLDNWTYAANLAEYSSVVSTASDSVAGSNPRTAFMVSLEDYDQSSEYWFSAPDSGYSVDNIGPAAPAAFAGAWGEGAARLHWAANDESDLAGYRLYRGVTADFVTDERSLVATPSEPGHADVAEGAFVYKLTAVDVHGNESPAAVVAMPGALPSTAVPAALAFAAPSPNPARGATALRWALPAAGHARIEIFDAAGRRVRVLHDADAAAGEHAVTFDLRDDGGRVLPRGLYLARLEAAGEARTRRLLVLP